MIRLVRPADAAPIRKAHEQLYGADYGFDDSFGATVCAILDRFLAAPGRGQGWVVETGKGVGGSIFCMEDPEAPSRMRLRLFYLVHEMQGQGLGARLLSTCIDHARAAGAQDLILSTHAEHRAACALYDKAGFACIRSEPVVAYGQPMTEQDWLLPLKHP